jgi:hypothetical protein
MDGYKHDADKSDFIHYKIVDSNMGSSREYYKVQCIYTKAILDLSIEDIVFDLDILHGLHPTQGCFIGIEYAKIIKNNERNPQIQEKSRKIISQYSVSRYGNYNLLYQTRNGHLGFESKRGNEQHLMDPRDIALSQELIEEFDATQAFCIGVLSGLKFVNPMIQNQSANDKKAYLRLVK